jgi:2'-5' RNA ligase
MNSNRGRGGYRRPGAPGFARPEDDPPGTSRLFIAVPVADEIRDAIGTLMETVAGAPIDERSYGQPRWVRVEGLHLTLRFLGATPDERQGDVAAAVAAATTGTAPFRVCLSGGGCFPNPIQPRVLWVGIVEGAESLEAIVRRLDAELAPLGWPPETRPFNPHLTLARTDGVPGADEKARRLMEAARGLELSWQAGSVILYKSVQGRGPSRYEALATAPLAAS